MIDSFNKSSSNVVWSLYRGKVKHMAVIALVLGAEVTAGTIARFLQDTC